MSARQRRRRRPAPRRRIRRWLRRQGRLTRGLLVAVALLSIAVVGLLALLQDGNRRPQRAARTAAPPAADATTVSNARPRTEPAAPRSPRDAPAAVAARAPEASPRVPSRPARPVTAPRAAIVIDDLGQSYSHLQQLAALEIPLSIAVIPGLPATGRTVRAAARLGIELLVHLPMEPREETGKNPGDGVLLTTMPEETLRERVRAGIAAVPGAVGVNNHMGSRFTEDADGLGVVMTELRDHGLFWLDSRTTPATRGPEAARGAGVEAIERDVFLDAETGTEFVRGQVRRLIEVARARGTAVGIGHPHPETIAVLRELRGELLASGVRLVPVSQLVGRNHDASPPVAAAGRAPPPSP